MRSKAGWHLEDATIKGRVVIVRCWTGSIAALLMMAFGNTALSAPQQQLGSAFRCNYAKIKPPGARPYSQPTLVGRYDHRLRAGSTVYICDETEDSYQVFYAAPGRRCPGTVNGLENERANQWQRDG